MNNLKQKVFVAMSGGVDSAVAALLLKKQGYDVTGVYMKNWSDPLANECPWKKDIKDFYQICKNLSIPYRIEIFEEEYRKKVVKYLINGYRKGITPNPDIICNREIKFKLFLDKARQLGADMIATGHYAIKKVSKGSKQELYQAKDLNKDQTYFLALLNQKQLKYSLFPIGEYTKPQIRRIAKKAGLKVYNKKDSQGICFIGKVKFKDFIRKFIKNKTGPIKLTNGKIIGYHQGLFLYTIGQRHGLEVGGGIPFYVIEKNIKKNTLIVASKDEIQKLYHKKLIAKKIYWIDSNQTKFPIKCHARIRYQQPLQLCRINKKESAYLISFINKQRAITPGQFVIFYKEKKVLGGGEISKFC